MIDKPFGASPWIGALFLALLSLVVGQASIFAILPPLGREFGFTDLEISTAST